MEIEYQITEADYAKSAKLGSTATRKQFVWMGAVGFGLLLLAIFGPRSLKVIGYCGLVGGIVGYFVTVHVVAPWQARKSYRSYKMIHQPLRLQLTGDGFTVKAANGVTEVKWEHLLKWRENKEFILIYIAPKMYFLVPRRLADEGFEIEDLRRLLREKLGPPV